MLILLASGYELVEEPKQFVNLWLRKICVVGGVLDLKRKGMLTFSGHDVRQRVQAWIADGDADGVVSVFLEKLNKDAFAVEAAFAPSSKRNFVNFFHCNISPMRACSFLWSATIKKYCT